VVGSSPTAGSKHNQALTGSAIRPSVWSVARLRFVATEPRVRRNTICARWASPCAVVRRSRPVLQRRSLVGAHHHSNDWASTLRHLRLLVPEEERAVFISELQIRDTSGIEAPSISRPTAPVCLIDYGQVAETIFTASTCMWCSVASFVAVVPSALAASAAFIVVPVIVTLWPT
jgi:hypothetical protein